MLSGYIPIFIFLAIAIGFPVVTILAAKLIPLVPINVPVTCPACACPHRVGL